MAKPRADLGLCWGTVARADLPELIEVAGAAGFGAIAVRPAMYFASIEAGLTDAELRRRLDDNGVRVTVIDPLITGLPAVPTVDEVAPDHRSFFRHGEADCFRAAEALRAETVNVVHWQGRDTSLDALADAVGGMGERAREHGVDVAVEFMPSSGIPDLAFTRRLIERAGSDNVGVLFDTWHFVRSGGRMDELRALPHGAISALQVSDRAAADIRPVQVSMSGRSLPGDGEFPLAEMLDIILPANPGLNVAVEVFNDELGRMPPAEAAKRAFAAIEKLVPDRR